MNHPGDVRTQAQPASTDAAAATTATAGAEKAILASSAPARNLPGLWADACLAAATALIFAALTSPRFPFDAPAEVLAAAGIVTLTARLDLPSRPGQARGSRKTRAGVVAMTLALAAAWTATRGGFAAFCCLLAWSVFAIRRLTDARDTIDSEVQFRRLFLDGGVMLAGLLLAWSFLDSGNSGAGTGVSGGTIPAGGAGSAAMAASGVARWLYLGAVALRVAALRRAQIELAREAGAQDFPGMARVLAPAGMALAAAVGVILSPALRPWFILTGLIGIFVWWLLRERRLDASWLVPFLLLFLIPLLQHMRWRALPWLPQPLAGLPHLKQAATAYPHPPGPNLSALWTGLGWLLLLALVAYLAWKWRQAGPPAAVSDDPPPVIERRRLPRRPPHEPAVPPTPVRRLLQAWFAAEAARGRVRRPGETAAQFAARWREEQQRDTASIWLAKLVPLYEADRYGEVPAPEDEVARIAEAMRQDGVLPPDRRGRTP
ncbi:hypothetical protein GCM10010885_15050 [Alicyclobacillus cellulosilyticus]|uniref:Protein-glutamine gamma-glutamyltransferase-like C-terminal domain-containing protein n=1 Tax=Alicyclobacillus cellulosilyticus TaxID=1003997 RepID=A0A917NK84_9BACL|nr:DUF4129 domain-containing protein [Alicyclobacillus cellulosilyticus]GGJ06906.1 hypothetical protein GCM10010885_15050 [Alicyclobacillus cellulosilyticus]